MKLKAKKLKAFTLQELLVVLAIIGILILLALPNLLPLISKAKSTEAQIQLSHVYTLETNYFYLNSKYSNDFSEIGFEQAQLVTEGGKGNYKIEISSVSASGFVAQAKAVVDFDGDGIFNIWQIDEKNNLEEVVKD